MGETDPLMVSKQSVPSFNGCPVMSHRPRRLLVLVILSACSLCSNLCFAFLVTFFPEESARRGSNSWKTGFIFSIFELGCIVSSPLCGQFMTRIGSKFLLVSGMFSLSVTTGLLGTLVYSKGGPSFVYLSLTIRAMQGISAGAHNTALLTTIANQFPDRVAEALAITESCIAVAFLVGPLIGGLLYEQGGFLLPFVVIGSLDFLLCLLAGFCLKSPQDESNSTPVGSVFQLLRVPGVCLPLATILSVTFTMSFLDLTLAMQMDTFGVSTAIKGLLFTTISATYAVANIFWGKLADKKGYCKPIMMCGSFINSVALLLLGPSPVAGIASSLPLMGTSLGLLGIGIGAHVVPPVITLLQSVKGHGYPDDLSTDALVSGLTYTVIPLGAFLGPSIGGFIIDAVGFPWSTTGLAVINISLALSFLISYVNCTKYTSREKC